MGEGDPRAGATGPTPVPGGANGSSPRGGGSTVSGTVGAGWARAGCTVAENAAANSVIRNRFPAVAAMPFLRGRRRMIPRHQGKGALHTLLIQPRQDQSDDAVERSTRRAQRLDPPRDGRVFFQRRRVVRLDACVNHQRPRAAPVFVPRARPDAVDVHCRIRAGERHPQPVFQRMGRKVAVVHEHHQAENRVSGPPPEQGVTKLVHLRRRFRLRVRRCTSAPRLRIRLASTRAAR